MTSSIGSIPTSNPPPQLPGVPTWLNILESTPEKIAGYLEDDGRILICSLGDKLQDISCNDQEARSIAVKLVDALVYMIDHDNSFIADDLLINLHNDYLDHLRYEGHFTKKDTLGPNFVKLIDFCYSNNDFAMVAKLITFESKSDGIALDVAIRNKDTKKIAELSDNIDLETFVFLNGDSPVHRAVRDPGVLKALLDLGFNASLYDSHGQQPIHTLMTLNNGEEQKLKALDVFEESCIPIDTVTKEGKTLLHLAIQNNCDDVAGHLLDSNINVNAQDASGKTALMLACERMRCDYDVIDAFIINNADPSIRDKNNRDCFDAILNSNVAMTIKRKVLERFLGSNFQPSFTQFAEAHIPALKFHNAKPFEYDAKTLLANTVGFVRQCSDPVSSHGFVGEVQGEALFRNASATIDPLIYHSSLFPQFQSINPVLYSKLIVKRVAHVLGLGNTSENKTNEGFSEAFAIPMTASSLVDIEEMSTAEIDWVYDRLKNAYIADKMEPQDYIALSDKFKTMGPQDVIVIGSGWDWHFRGWVFFENLAFHINRGAEATPGSEIQVYEMPDAKLMTPEMLERMINRYKYTKDTCIKTTEVETTLKLIKIFSSSLKLQKKGYCTFATSKGLVLILMAILHLIKQKNEPAKPLDQKLKSAFELSKPVYKSYTKLLRENSLRMIFQSIDLIFEKTKYTIDDVQIANRYYNLLLQAAIEMSTMDFSKSNELVKRLPFAYRLAIWKYLVKLNNIIN